MLQLLIISHTTDLIIRSKTNTYLPVVDEDPSLYVSEVDGHNRYILMGGTVISQFFSRYTSKEKSRAVQLTLFDWKNTMVSGF